MTKLLNTIIALAAIGVAMKAKKRNYLITNSDDELLVDIYGNTIIHHKNVKVYVNGKLI